MKIPKDNELIKEKYDDMICGQSCLAVLENTSVENIMNQWINLFGEFKGFSPFKDVISFLKNKGYEVKRKKLIESRDCIYIARVQWFRERENKNKPYFGWGSWYEASNHTHFVILIPKEGKFFCNMENRWRNILDIESYLNERKGVITSLIAITHKV